MLVAALEADALILFVAGQHEEAADAFGGDKALEQRRGKLNGLAIGATGNHLTDRAPVIIQIRLCRDLKLKHVLMHVSISTGCASR